MVGVLISYFNAHYGPSFFVVLSAAFYMPGIGVSYIQKRLDTVLDERLGVKASFVVRSTGCMGGLAVAMLAFPASFVGGGRGPPLMMMFLSGVLTWWSHGTASVVTLLFPPDANVASDGVPRARARGAAPRHRPAHRARVLAPRRHRVSLVFGASLSRAASCAGYLFSAALTARDASRTRTSQGRQDAALERHERRRSRRQNRRNPYQKTIRTYYCPRGVALLFSLSGAVLRLRQVGGG